MAPTAKEAAKNPKNLRRTRSESMDPNLWPGDRHVAFGSVGSIRLTP